MKLYKIILKKKKNNILIILYKFFLLFKMLKIYKKLYFYKQNEVNYIKYIKKEKKKFFKIFNNYIFKLKNNLKFIYIFKLFLKKFLEINKLFSYNKISKKIIKKYKNILKKQRKISIFTTYFYLLGKGNLFFAIKNKKIIRRNYKKILKYNFYTKSLFFKKNKICESRVQILVLRFLRKKIKKIKFNYTKKRKFFV